MNTKMKIVRKNMLARDLKGLIDLPGYDDNQRVEVTVYPDTDTDKEKKPLSSKELKAILDRLTGCLQGVDKSKTLDDWRTERLEERYGIKFAD